jgi:parallel beta-helix repeat protein
MTTDLAKGEFTWDGSTLYVNVGEDPSNGIVEACQRSQWANLNSAALHLSNLAFKYSNFFGLNFSSADNVIVDDCDFYYSASTFTVRLQYYNENCEIKNSTFTDCKMSILLANSSDTEIPHALVSGNEITNSDWYRSVIRYTGSIALEKAYGATVTGNYIHDVAGDGIMLRQCGSANTISNNIIVRSCDGIAIEGSAYQGIYHNTVAFETTQLEGGDAYPRLKLGDDFGNGVSADYNIIKNNIFVSDDNLCIQGEDIGTNNQLDNNIYYREGSARVVKWKEEGSTWSGTLPEFQAAYSNKYEQHGIAENPVLLGNIPMNKSIACAGATGLGIETDVNGNARGVCITIGAHEIAPPMIVSNVIICNYQPQPLVRQPK